MVRKKYMGSQSRMEFASHKVDKLAPDAVKAEDAKVKPYRINGSSVRAAPRNFLHGA